MGYFAEDLYEHKDVLKNLELKNYRIKAQRMIKLLKNNLSDYVNIDKASSLV